MNLALGLVLLAIAGATPSAGQSEETTAEEQAQFDLLKKRRLERLGIPPLFDSDAAYGVRSSGENGKYSTALPSSLGAASSWDIEGAFDQLNRAQLEVGTRTFELCVRLLCEPQSHCNIGLAQVLLRADEPHPNRHQVNCHEGEVGSTRWGCHEIG